MSKVSKQPKYDIDHPLAVYFVPECLPGENFEMITDVAAPGVLPYYAISNYGRIWHIYDNHFMSTSWDGPGYRIAVLRLRNGRAHTFRVHRLLMMTHRYFEGCENMVINHIDGCKTRNYIDFPGISNPDNLEWCDMSYNMKEAHRIGLKKAKFGTDHPRAIMDEEVVKHVCELIVAGTYTPKQISEITGVSIANYENIKYKKTWKHISKDYF
jgi:hypothetical protein